jgi:hypothetical protein
MSILKVLPSYHIVAPMLCGGLGGFRLFSVFSTLLHLPPRARIEPGTVATLALTDIRSNHSARSHPLSARFRQLLI